LIKQFNFSEGEMTAVSLNQQPATLLQQLIRFDTTNPPGNEAACVAFICGLLAEAGIESVLLGKSPERPNLVARIPGRGSAPPLMLYGHADVVTTENQDWTYPPFEGRLEDGYVWGRGALDMKGPLAMLLSAFLKAKVEGTNLPGDVLMVVVADEENTGKYGARFLVEEHADLFTGVRYALGEFGGFNLDIAGKRFRPIMVSEKQICWIRVKLRGAGGHGSMPVRGGAMARLGRMLKRLDEQRLPTHITPPARAMIQTVQKTLGGLQGQALGLLLNPLLTNRLLDMLGPTSRAFDPLLHNTLSPTGLRGSNKANVIPSEVIVDMDGRLLPGFQPEDMISELHALVGKDIDVEVMEYDPGPGEPDMALYDTLGKILREADPKSTPMPLLLSGVTDGRFFTRLGIQTYGFVPLDLPEDFDFLSSIHAANERVPASALDFGVQAIFQALERFGEAH
jgi:acetylornithine deacetylase/succinyl-diaminopimelate desuccinylase-like protein